MDNGAAITSSGGSIYIAGSNSTDANDYPAGHAYTNDTTNNLALKLGSNSANAAVSITSGGGNIRIYGQTGSSAAHAMAVQSTTASTINAGAGRIDVDLQSTNTNDNVLEAWTGGLTVTSTAAADAVYSVPAVKWSVKQNNSGAAYNAIQTGGVFSINATGGGDIDFTATSANTSTYAFDSTKNFQLLASTGQIRANFGANGLDLTGAVSNGFILGAISGGTSSSNVILTGDRFNEATANSTASAMVIRTSGTATIRPTAQSFSAAQTFDSTWSFAGVNSGNIGAVTFGQSGTNSVVSGATQNASDVTVSGGITAAGAISVYGKTVTVGASLTTTGSSPILLKGAQDVLLSNGTNTSTRNALTTANSVSYTHLRAHETG
jgi:hypothetical protein